MQEWSAAESPAFAALRAHVATTLHADAAQIAARWVDQSRSVTLRAQDDATLPTDAAARLVESVAAALMMAGAAPDDLISRGLAFGTEAFEQGESLHHALKGLDLLSAMMLYATETSVAACLDSTAPDGVRVSRRLQQATSLLGLSVTKGYTQAMNAAMRGRFRRLRHDLRNPLGTIKSVLAMMDDETMPVEARANPRFRAMAKRNARSLGELIADRLSDVEAVVPALALQSASLRTVACAVRRDLRAAAAARGATVAVVGSMPARVMVDAIGLELVLHELLHAALHDASPGDELTVEFGGLRDGRASLVLHCSPVRQPIAAADTLQYLTHLAAQMQGDLRLDERALTLRMPASPVDPSGIGDAAADATVAATPATMSSGGGEPGHDLSGEREREHGESRAL